MLWSAPVKSTLADPTRSDAGPPTPRPRPQLFLVMECGNPFAPQARFSLHDLDEVTIGRGRRRQIQRADARLDVRSSDPWMSSAHARFTRGLGRWSVRDEGSRNGIVRNGARVDEAVLVDGDVLEIGHTFFLYREAVATTADDPEVLELSPLHEEIRGLATLHPELAAQLRLVESLAPSLVPMVIHGESGTGKEVMARAIHALSQRGGRYVAVNCGAIPADLVEAELFGAMKGAFTGATEDRPGLVRSADGGTLFLDEIADLPARSQATFLRVLQEREVVPVGGTRPIPVNVRLIAASHQSLPALVAAGRFRSDLFARLSGFSVRLPALRERREDFGLVVAALLAHLTPDATEPPSFTVEAVRRLLAYHWPLNIRELEKALQTALVLAGQAPIDLTHFPQLPEPVAPPRVEDPADQEGRAELMRLLEEHGGNLAAVARVMGKDRTQIRRWLKRYGLDPDKFR